MEVNLWLRTGDLAERFDENRWWPNILLCRGDWRAKHQKQQPEPWVSDTFGGGGAQAEQEEEFQGNSTVIDRLNMA